MRLQYRLDLLALNTASNSYSVHLNVYMLPSGVFACILSFCLLLHVLVIVMSHALNISANSKQEDPYSGADERTCVILMPE